VKVATLQGCKDFPAEEGAVDDCGLRNEERHKAQGARLRAIWDVRCGMWDLAIIGRAHSA